MTSLRFYRFNRTLHKWMGLVLVIQLIFWIGGGTIMASLDIDAVHGDHLHHPQRLALPNDRYQYPIQNIIGVQVVDQLQFISVNQEPVYKIKIDQQRYYSAIDGRELSLLNDDQVSIIAKTLYTGSAGIIDQQLLTELPMEARPLKAPMWRINFADNINTSFYIHPVSGELQRVRSDIWRLFDFVWMLHIMDYDERDDFNHPLLVVFALSALIFTLTGAVMLYQLLIVMRPRKRI
jgi:hypothetical protein